MRGNYFHEIIFPAAFALLLAGFLLAPSNSHSAIYKWVDKNGQTHITDYQPGSDEMAEEEAITEKPAKGFLETRQPADEKPEAPMARSLPPKKPLPPPEVKPSSPPDTPAQSPPRLPAGLEKFPISRTPGLPQGPLAAMISWILTFSLIIGIISYVFFSLCLYLIAKKLGVPAPWLAWIPIVQVYTFVVAAKGTDESPLLWIIGLIIPLVSIVVVTYLWMCISENMGKEKLLGLLTLIPIVNFVFMAWLAFQKAPSAAPEEAFAMSE